MDLSPQETAQILAQREARKLNAAGGYGPRAKLGQQETHLLEQLADLTEARLAMGYSVIGQGRPVPATSYGSAYRGASAAHTRAREVAGTAESDPSRTSAACFCCNAQHSARPAIW
jgi:hypothetical protein